MRNIVLIVSILLMRLNGTAQWTPMSTAGLPSNPDITSIATVSGTNVFVGTWGKGVYLTINNGASWVAVNNGLTSLNVWTLTANGNDLYAATESGGIYVSTNNGAQWTAINSGLTTLNVNSLEISGTNMFAGTLGGGIFLSTNSGGLWTQVNMGLTNLYIISFNIDGTNIFAGNDGSFAGNGGVALSTNNGNTWTPLNTGLVSNSSVHSLVTLGAIVYAGTAGYGVIASSDSGTTWSNSGLTNMFVNEMLVHGNDIYASTMGLGVHRLVNNGGIWTAINTGLTDLFVTTLALNATTIYAGTYGKVFYRDISNITTSINKVLPEQKVTVYPNPFTIATTIEIKENIGYKNTSIVVYDVLGKEIIALQNITTQKITIDKNEIANGVYFYKLIQENKMIEAGKLFVE